MYKIVIPSYKRPKILFEKTLKLLQRLNVDFSTIDIVVETEEMRKEYLDYLPFNLNIIVSNTNGIKGKRNFIRKYYQQETDEDYLLCIDDDIDELYDMDTPITTTDFNEAVETGFVECEKKGYTMWGVSPFHNTFFLKNVVSYNLKYICGTFFGLIIDRSYDPLQTTFNHYEDFCFTCKHFLRDDGVVRLNWIAIKTKYFNPKGGITEWYGGKEERKKAQEEDAITFTEIYPKMARIIDKKYGKDIRLNPRYKAF